MSSSSDEDSEEEDEEEDDESESELLSLPESESDVAFFLAAAFVLFYLPSDESEEPDESESDSDAAALPFVRTGVYWAFCKALAASFAAFTSSSDQIGFSLNVASCFS